MAVDKLNSSAPRKVRGPRLLVDPNTPAKKRGRPPLSANEKARRATEREARDAAQSGAEGRPVKKSRKSNADGMGSPMNAADTDGSATQEPASMAPTTNPASLPLRVISAIDRNLQLAEHLQGRIAAGIRYSASHGADPTHPDYITASEAAKALTAVNNATSQLLKTHAYFKPSADAEEDAKRVSDDSVALASAEKLVELMAQEDGSENFDDEADWDEDGAMYEEVYEDQRHA